jgi:pyrroline-5-carboxylate reductase
MTPLKNTIALIGAGQMGKALAQGFCNSGECKPSEIIAYDPSEVSRANLVEAIPGVNMTQSVTEAIQAARYVILAVKPQHATDVCQVIQPVIQDETIVISIIAGLPTSWLSNVLKTSRIVRVMPNTPCLIGQGVSAITFPPDLKANDVNTIQKLFMTVGVVHAVPESMLDAVTAVSGSGPGYVALLIDALADGGVQAGLPRQLALDLAVQTFAGTASLIAETGDHPAVVKDRVSSPGGTTIAGLSVLERKGVRGALADAVAAAAARSSALAQSVN